MCPISFRITRFESTQLNRIFLSLLKGIVFRFSKKQNQDGIMCAGDLMGETPGGSREGSRRRLGELWLQCRFGFSERRGGRKKDWVGKDPDDSSVLRMIWPGWLWSFEPKLLTRGPPFPAPGPQGWAALAPHHAQVVSVWEQPGNTWALHRCGYGSGNRWREGKSLVLTPYGHLCRDNKFSSQCKTNLSLPILLHSRRAKQCNSAAFTAISLRWSLGWSKLHPYFH